MNNPVVTAQAGQGNSPNWLQRNILLKLMGHPVLQISVLKFKFKSSFPSKGLEGHMIPGVGRRRPSCRAPSPWRSTPGPASLKFQFCLCEASLGVKRVKFQFVNPQVHLSRLCLYFVISVVLSLLRARNCQEKRGWAENLNFENAWRKIGNIVLLYYLCDKISCHKDKELGLL